MKVILAFEANESLPPDLCTQLLVAITRIVDSYGLGADVILDRRSELEAHQRFWAWRLEQRRAEANDFPKTPGDSEVS